MIVKMRLGATPEEVEAVEARLLELDYQSGKLVGQEVTLIGIYGDISRLPKEEILGMAGVEGLIPISRGYKRASQIGGLMYPIFTTFPVGNVTVGENLVIIAGPCSVESESQIMESARVVKRAGCHILRGGVVKYRSSPYSGWEGLGAGSVENLRKALAMIVKAGKEYELPTAIEILDHAMVEEYEDAEVGCLQIGEPNCRNTALLNRLRETKLPVIHKRGNSLDVEDYLLWTERMMTEGKKNIILCERGVMGPSRYTRNTLDLGSIAALRYQISHLPVAVDASHGTGIRDLVFPMTLAGIMSGANIVLVEAHPNPLIAKSDRAQGLFPQQLMALVAASHKVWNLRENLSNLYIRSASLAGE